MGYLVDSPRVRLLQLQAHSAQTARFAGLMSERQAWLINAVLNAHFGDGGESLAEWRAMYDPPAQVVQLPLLEDAA
jgi:hypothetical protein